MADNSELMTLAGRHLDQYHAALGMRPADIAALHAASRSAGHWYPSASVPVNILQYAIPALLGATGHAYWYVGFAGLSAGFGVLLTGLLQ